VLQGAVQGIAELITRPGLINVDFADVRTVMSETGTAMMGTGFASGEGRAQQAAGAAVSSPLLEDINLAGAHGLLVNVTAGLDLSIGEFEEVGRIVKEYASEDATVVVGTVIDPEMSNQIRVTVVATGLGRLSEAASLPAITRGRVDPREALAERAAAMREGGYGGREAFGRGAEPAPGRAALRSRAPLTPSDYSALDKPTIVRQRAVGDGLSGEPAEDLLDIPAFLRRQAD
jgi:cell division protein FtsZ